jgi:hypothetical protein
VTTTDRHPAWCSPAYCDLNDPDLPTDDGFHQSQPITVDLDMLISPYGRITTATCWIQQAAWPDTAVPFFHLRLAPDAELFVPLAQASEAMHKLAALQTTH